MLTNELRSPDRKSAWIILHNAVGFFRRQSSFMVSAVLVVAISSVLFSYLVPLKYTAAASVVLERRYSSFLRRQSERPRPAAEIASDLINIATSDPVINAAVGQLRQLIDEPQRSAIFDYLYGWGVLTERSVRRRLTSDLKIKAEDSYITILVSDEDPEFAMHAVNALVNELRRRYVDLFGLKNVHDTHHDRLLRAKSEFTAQHRRATGQSIPFSTRQVQRNSVDPKLEAAHSAQPDSTGDATAKAVTEEELRRALLARAQANAVAGRQIVTPPETFQPYRSSDYDAILYELRQLRELGASLEREKQKLQVRYAPGHPDMLSLQQRIDSINDAVAAREKGLKDIAWEGATSLENQALMRSLGSRLDSIQQRIDTALLYARSDPRALGVRVAEYAEIPSYPDMTRLSKLLNGLITGVVFALSAAFVRDRLRFGRSISM